MTLAERRRNLSLMERNLDTLLIGGLNARSTDQLMFVATKGDLPPTLKLATYGDRKKTPRQVIRDSITAAYSRAGKPYSKPMTKHR